MFSVKSNLSFVPNTVYHHSDDEPVVQPNLAMTPTMMGQMLAQGKTITTSNLNTQYIDGDVNATADVPLERMRGIDINDLWNQQQDARRKVNEFHKELSNMDFKTE